MARPNYESVDDYIAAQPTPVQSVLARVRATIRSALPNAAEEISYQIPVYKLNGAMVLYFAAFKHHYSIYPATRHLLSVLDKELSGFLHHKATLRFALAEKIPTRLIARIAKVRAAEATELQKAKAAKKATKKKPKSKAARKPGKR